MRDKQWEAKVYWELVDKGKSHLEAWEIVNSASKIKRYGERFNKPDYKLPKV